MRQLKDMTLEELWQLFPIILKEYNEEYEGWYKEEKNNILTALINYDVVRINHIGSTAVKGLIAKPIIDILLELPIIYDTDKIIANLTMIGWNVMNRSNENKTISLNKGYTINGFAKKVFHLHVKPVGDWGELYFRDYLKTHPNIAKEYAELKISLKDEFEHNRDGYTEAKTDFVMKYTKIAKEEFKDKYLL